MAKVAARPEQRRRNYFHCQYFSRKVIDVGRDSLVVEMTGSKSKLAAFIDLLGEYEILELARAGVTGLSRGSSGCEFATSKQSRTPQEAVR